MLDINGIIIDVFKTTVSCLIELVKYCSPARLFRFFILKVDYEEQRCDNFFAKLLWCTLDLLSWGIVIYFITLFLE